VRWVEAEGVDQEVLLFLRGDGCVDLSTC
jgi:hypothetical protein